MCFPRAVRKNSTCKQHLTANSESFPKASSSLVFVQQDLEAPLAARRGTCIQCPHRFQTVPQEAVLVQAVVWRQKKQDINTRKTLTGNLISSKVAFQTPSRGSSAILILPREITWLVAAQLQGQAGTRSLRRGSWQYHTHHLLPRAHLQRPTQN